MTERKAKMGREGKRDGERECERESKRHIITMLASGWRLQFDALEEAIASH